MRRLALFLAIILIITMPLSVSAATRATTINPTIGFSGTTAECEVVVVGNYSTDYIEVTMKLMRGSSCVDIWKATGYGYLYLYKETNVLRNVTYTLVAEVKINNVALTPVSVSDKC